MQLIEENMVSQNNFLLQIVPGFDFFLCVALEMERLLKGILFVINKLLIAAVYLRSLMLTGGARELLIGKPWIQEAEVATTNSPE